MIRGSEDKLDILAQEKDGDFSMPVALITRTKAKRLKEDFENLAKAIVKEMHQEWAKETKMPTHTNGQPKILLFAANWA